MTIKQSDKVLRLEQRIEAIERAMVLALHDMQKTDEPTLDRIKKLEDEIKAMKARMGRKEFA
jgi:hypothetical protein